MEAVIGFLAVSITVRSEHVKPGLNSFLSVGLISQAGVILLNQYQPSFICARMILLYGRCMCSLTDMHLNPLILPHVALSQALHFFAARYETDLQVLDVCVA